jgi:hypothetical protein
LSIDDDAFGVRLASGVTPGSDGDLQARALGVVEVAARVQGLHATDSTSEPRHRHGIANRARRLQR